MALIALMALAAVIRIHALGAAALWADEAISADRAALPLHTIFSLSNLNVQMPIFYAALHAWSLLFGGSDVALRAFSVMAGLLCIPLVYVAGARLFGRAAGWVAAVFLSVHPAHVYFSREARGYSVMMTVECATFALLPPMMDGRASIGPAILLASLQILGMSLHHVFIPVALMQTLFVVVICLRAKRFKALVSYVAVLAVYGFGVSLLWLAQARMLLSQWNPPRYPGVIGALEIVGTVFGDGIYYAGAVALIGLLAVGFLAGRVRISAPAALLAACTIVPLAICVGLPLVVVSLPVKFRCATPAIPALALLVGLAVEKARTGSLRVIVAAAVLLAISVAGMVGGLPSLYARTLHQDWRAIADYVAHAYVPGRTELVVSLKDEGRLLRRYAAGRLSWDGMDKIGFEKPVARDIDASTLRARLKSKSRFIVLEDDWFAADEPSRWKDVAGQFGHEQRTRLAARLGLTVFSTEPVSLPAPESYGDMENRMPHVCTR
jgi:mannosyltransferase